MARIFPFQALLPSKDFELKVSANTHVDDMERQKEIVRSNPLTYINVVKPYLKSGEEKDPDRHFPLAKMALDELIRTKVMSMDEEDSLYIYRQFNVVNGDEFIGLICNVSAQDYYDGKIKIHEKTLTDKEQQLIKHIRYSGAIGEPVLMTHRMNKQIVDILNHYEDILEPAIDFVDELGREHQIYKVYTKFDIDIIKDIYEASGELYIADGHHRSAASSGYFKEENVVDGHYLAYLVPPEFLKIDSFHRAFKSDISFDAEEFLNALRKEFHIDKVKVAFQPHKEKDFGLLLNNEWYKLTYRGKTSQLNAVDVLDVSILERHVFSNVLKIEDSKTDKRLSFIKGSTPVSQLETDVAEGKYNAVFTVFPCTIQHIFDVADNALIMPPKSTYIEPKLRTGLTVQLVKY